MSHPDSSLKTVILSDASNPLGAGLRTALEENRWAVQCAPADAKLNGRADVLILLEAHVRGSAKKREDRVADLMASAISAGIPRVVLVSNVAVYDHDASAFDSIRETSGLRQDRQGTPMAIRAALRFERIVQDAKGIEFVILRIPQLYDPSDPTALSTLQDCLDEREDEGQETRFQRLHPDDFHLAIQVSARRGGAAGEIFNIVEPMAITQDVLTSELNRLGRLLSDPENEADRIRPEYSCVTPIYASDKAGRLLDFRPKRSCWVGLAACAQAMVSEMRRMKQLSPKALKLPPVIDAIENRSGCLQGKVCVVSGATEGIGRNLCVLLSRCGATVVAVGNDAAAGAELVGEFAERPSCTEGVFIAADLSKMADIRRATQDILLSHPRVDALINCASGFFQDRQMTVEGIEANFALNYLAHFQLTDCLIRALDPEGHIINVNTELHKGSGVDFSDLFCAREYDPADSFARAKFAGMMFSNSLSTTVVPQGPKVVTVSPGLDPIPTRSARAQGGFALNQNANPAAISSYKAATHIADILVDDRMNTLSGIYVDQDNRSQYDPNTDNREACAHMWRVSQTLLGTIQT